MGPEQVRGAQAQAVAVMVVMTYLFLLLFPHLSVNQLEEERLATIERDNHILSSKLSDIMRSKGLVDHRNSYPERSLNAEKRRQQLQEVNRVNQGILERITIQESEYRRQRWEEDWERAERCRDDIARYPHRVTNQQRYKKVLFQQATDLNEKQISSSLSEQ
ncbi:hypothetical protein EOD39_18161 [Acipenser ruthenus]|uniref:Uncharacterized protein n=1 Tax=Acipenser ruthenus TaxID=7906 RepID=A0A444V1L1_ACIRT|nr:hypothetical protein EOD39_18161 [Acipenser ruthenus]